jgi:imidazolonepropionase-like amidohydrolase
LSAVNGRVAVALFVLAVLGIPQVGGSAEHWTVLRCGTLLAVPGSEPLSPATVIARDDRIVDVRPGLPVADELGIPSDAEVEVVDLTQRFVLPGLIDSHTHITSEYTRGMRLRRVEESEADAAIYGVVHARRTLLAGFTTIRNVGSRGDSAFALRDAIRAGRVPGPRILVAGESLTPTGGHSDHTLGYREDLFGPPGVAEGVCDGVDACRRAVRAQVKRGADLIKLTATGGVLSSVAAGTEQQFFEDALRAIVEASHLLGKKVAAHAHGARGIHAALRAGVDSIDHGTFLDTEAVRLFGKTGAFLVPTVLAGKTVAERAEEPGYYPPPVAQKAREVGPQIQSALGRAYRGGVRIAFGTDSGVSRHGENAREFALMVEAEMTPVDAIAAATVNAAELLGLSDEIGTIEPGKSADVIATMKSPLDEIGVLADVRFVMRAGVVHRNE